MREAATPQAGRLLVGVLSTLLASVTPVAGQTDADPAVEIDAPLLDWSHAERAYRLVEHWVQIGAVPRMNVPEVRVTGAIGVKVTMRSAGYVLGTGEAYRDDLGAAVDRPGPSIDLTPLLQEATRLAFEAVDESMKDAALRAVLEGRLDPGAGKPTRKQLADFVLIDVQFGHSLESIRLPADAVPDAVFGTFAPDYHGLRVIAPGAREPHGAILWPASALAANISPASQLAGLLKPQGGAAAIKELARPKGAALQRFEVIHYVRPRRGERVTRLVRGNVIIDPQAINAASLGPIAERLTRHLGRRYTAHGVRGTYHPTSNQYRPLMADDEQTALADYAIARQYRLLSGQGGTVDPAVVGVAEAAHKSALDLARACVAPDADMPPAVTALTLLTLTDAVTPRGGAALRDQLSQRLLALRDDRGGFRSSTDEDAEPVTQATAALITAALAAHYERTLDPASAMHCVRR